MPVVSDLNFEKQEKLLSIPGACTHVTISCPHKLSWTIPCNQYCRQPSSQGRTRREADGFAFSALTVQKAPGDKTYTGFVHQPSHIVAR